MLSGSSYGVRSGLGVLCGYDLAGKKWCVQVRNKGKKKSKCRKPVIESNGLSSHPGRYKARTTTVEHQKQDSTQYQ